jgi:C4-dicarboxylate-specific signal transduction histidine kinase
MTRAFVEEGLFRPFATTKAAGFGIGMCQAREAVEHWGGRLEVESEPGAGTVVRVVLPLAAASDEGARREAA